jgi:hypothetical protein
MGSPVLISDAFGQNFIELAVEIDHSRAEEFAGRDHRTYDLMLSVEIPSAIPLRKYALELGVSLADRTTRGGISTSRKGNFPQEGPHLKPLSRWWTCPYVVVSATLLWGLCYAAVESIVAEDTFLAGGPGHTWWYQYL